MVVVVIRSNPRSENHMGMLTFCLPSTFTGGELVFRQDGNEIEVDWSGQVLTENGLGSVGWCFLYADCEHEVLPVKTGMRINLAYDVFYADVPELTVGDTRANGMLDILAKVFDLRNNLFPNGAKLGFGLRHAYAGKQGWVQMDHLENRLKGIDRTLMSVIKECVLEWKSVVLIGVLCSHHTRVLLVTMQPVHSSSRSQTLARGTCPMDWSATWAEMRRSNR